MKNLRLQVEQRSDGICSGDDSRRKWIGFGSQGRARLRVPDLLSSINPTLYRISDRIMSASTMNLKRSFDPNPIIAAR
jgi:hypothetical protein